MPAAPTSSPACKIPHDRAKLPDPILDLAKLKKVAMLLQWKKEGEERERERGGGVSHLAGDAAAVQLAYPVPLDLLPPS